MLTSEQILFETHVVEVVGNFVIVGFDETLRVNRNAGVLVILVTVCFFEVGAIVLWHI